MTAQDEIHGAIQMLLDVRRGAIDARTLRESVELICRAVRLPSSLDATLVASLPADIKALIIQQAFRHVQHGTHKTQFDHEFVASLLYEWFEIRLDPSRQPPKSVQLGPLPGRHNDPTIHMLPFGDTSMYLHLDQSQYRAARALVTTIARDAVLTADATSPPCELMEFVPLWLREPNRPASDHYITGEADDFGAYFTAQLETLRTVLGVNVQWPSRELAIIANSDALRFHRDRMVNQYSRLEDIDPYGNNYQLIQQLTLADWDMQAGTFSGTLIEHPDGDRYIFILEPGEVVGLLFSERPRFPGPMMMPYHCALPVLDRHADMTVGAAKGKRVSALVRGAAPARNLESLAIRSHPMDLGAATVEGEDRIYDSGMRVRPAIKEIPGVRPLRWLDGSREGISILECEQDEITQTLINRWPSLREGPTSTYRIEKVGGGFSNLSVIVPLWDTAEVAVVVNWSRWIPGHGLCHPIAIDRTKSGRPWLHLVRMQFGDAVMIPCPMRPLISVTPAEELLHRDSVLDSFRDRPVLQPRMTIALDVILFR